MEKIKLIFPILFFLLLQATLSLAHATPTIYYPSDGSALDTIPQNITITLSEQPDLSSSTLLLISPDDSRTNLPLQKIGTHTLFSAVAPHDNGTYLVSWNVLSLDDGHHTSGTWSFTIGSAHTMHAATYSYTTSNFNTLLVFIELLGLALATAGVLFSNTRFRTFGTTLIVLGALGQFARLETQLGTLVLAFQSVPGLLTLLRITCALALFIPVVTVQYAALLATLLLRARLSHASASDFYPLIAIFVTFIHTTAKSTLAGSQLYSALGKKPNNQLSNLALIFLLPSGVFLIWLHLKTLNNLHTLWGILVLLLCVITIAIIVFRIYHLRRATRTSLRIEAILGIALLLVSAHLMLTSPPQFGPAIHSSPGILVQGGTHELAFRFDAPVTNVTVLAESTSLPTPLVLIPALLDGTYVLSVHLLEKHQPYQVTVIGQRNNAYDLRTTFAYPATYSYAFALFSFILAVIGGALGYILYSKSKKH